MTMSQLLARWPQIQQELTALGVSMSLGQFLMLASALTGAQGDTGTPAPASGPTIPATLTLGADADLAPYGVALIGWSPQSHQGADLRDWKNAKYIVYAYLVANKIPPTSTWASDALSVLQSVVPSVPWTAPDSETLVYGDEFVHTAPRGHGDPGLRDRTDLNELEFFWGALSA